MKTTTLSRLAYLILFLQLGFAPYTAHAQLTESEKFHQILEDEWEWGLRENPLFATFIGDPRYDTEVQDLSLQAIEKRRRHMHEAKARLDTVDYAKLTEEEKLDFDLFRRRLELGIEGQAFRSEFIPVTQMDGIHRDLENLARVAPKNSVRDFENLITRLGKFHLMIDQTILLMEQGLAGGLMPPKVVLVDVANQIQAHIPEKAEDSPVYRTGFKNMPLSIPEAEQTRLRREAAKVITDSVFPAVEKLHKYWRNDYYPKTRKTIALSDLPNGTRWYQYRIKTMTTTDMTADEIHQLGHDEVRRIRKEMEKVKKQTGFDGDLKAFFDFIGSDEQFFYTEEAALISGYRDIAKRIDAELPKLFGKLPRLTFAITPIPEFSAKTMPTAYFYPGSLASGRASVFFANTYDLGSRPKWEMEALTLHEAMPGHHLQIALAHEQEGLANFRRYGGYTAFSEGWGLYAESLGEELGLYQDPYSKFGQLTYEMWRAIRLVLDTGIHAKGWTRQQAIDFFEDNAGKTEHDIRVEVDRYIVMPGQALAYKIGELKFKELRRRASRKLDDKFNIREFHDEALRYGALPLTVLEDKIDNWIHNYGDK